jgi:hypothetical protein
MSFGMKSLLWKEAFNIPKDSEHSLLEILRSGFINDEAYIQWASETYQLPVVDHEFFKTITNYKLLLEYPSPLWNETFFPVHCWENTLYIVCLEPQEIQLEQPHCFVLASLFRLETLWNKMEKPAASEEAVKDIPAMEYEQTIELKSTDVEEKLTSPDFSFDSLKTAEEPMPEAQAPQDAELVEPDIAQAPLMEDAPSESISFADVVPFTSVKPKQEENVYEDSKITSLFSQADSSTQISIPDFIIDELTRAAPEPTAADIERTQFFEKETTNVVPIEKGREITFTNTKTIMPFPERSTHFSFLRTVFSEQVILEARGKIKENTDPHQALICAFHILKDYYKKLMWAVRDQKGAVYPIASNSMWDFSEEAWNTPLDFKSPNPFRIAKFTAKPYHGEVYPNPINERFFQLWNNGKYPSVLTVVPVKMQGKVFAYFVGCEPALHFHPQNSLDIMQATCDELIQTFITIHKELNPTPKAS